MNLATFLDSTNLRPEAREKDIQELCREAAQYKFAAVCVHPYRLRLAKTLLAGSGVKLCTVVGFPLGADGLANKIYTARESLEEGADELDMVVNIGAFKDRDYATVGWEIRSLLTLKDDYNFVLKVIAETALLNQTELGDLTRLISDCGADYIKTSTGFSSRGVNLEDIRIIKDHKSDDLKIKASGGINTLDFALQLVEAGVHRLGSSSAGKLMEEQIKRGGR